MRSKFDEQMDELNNQMINMGTMIERSIAKAVEALTKKNSVLAEEVTAEDEIIDRQQKLIENMCFNLLIQQQPVAKDLRTITAAMKIVTDMERIGDHAADISEMVIFMGEDKTLDKFATISKMAAETMYMLNKSIEAYVERSHEKAAEVVNHDDIVDELFTKAKQDIINMIIDNPNDCDDAIDLILVSKYFERIGDHATNLAENIIFALDDKKNTAGN